MTKVAAGRMSAIRTRREVVVRDEDAWRALWSEHSRMAALPGVDFPAEMVVGIFSGVRPSAGYDVEITGARLDADTLVVEYVERQPVTGIVVAQLLTAPYHLVRVPAHAGDVRFEQKD